MAECKIKNIVNGRQTVDGAGVKLVRVLSRETAKEFDPFLMLDSFDSWNPEDYVKGFPMHPHRGIETITYLIGGEIEHKDSLGNSGTISSGEGQWMTAGRGILHQEMPRASEHMLGIQLWLNLPAHSKMTTPSYNDITIDNIPVVEVSGAVVRVISGSFQGYRGGTIPQHISASIYDIELEPGSAITLPVKEEETVFLFIVEGRAIIDEREVMTKSAVLLGAGDRVRVAASQTETCRFIFCSGKPLHESIAWGGPIVMNTQQELQQAFASLDNGTFIQEL